MNLTFENKTALITGAAGAIGKDIAQEMIDAGARVFITDLKQDAVDAAAAELGPNCRGLAADVTAEEQVVPVVDAAKTFLGDRIDVLVNCAGIIAQAPVEEITVEDWDKVFAVNCRGTFLLCKYVVPIMKRHGYGRIVNFSSKTGKTGSALMCHYSGAKAAIMGMTQSLAYELAKENITVNCVCPGITDNTGVWEQCSADYIQNLGKSREEVVKQFTAKIPLGRLAQIDDVVAVVLFFASEKSSYMTGQSINITGGREMH
ncbi:MAG TPA: SDR family NAD(P)-dependent oxidoreductase [Thermoguttaceae bacterium]|nr:SDR family NAD(P)-dependent oxidoreductase [Thermoguttaceae bacterium]